MDERTNNEYIKFDENPSIKKEVKYLISNKGLYNRPPKKGRGWEMVFGIGIFIFAPNPDIILPAPSDAHLPPLKLSVGI